VVDQRDRRSSGHDRADAFEEYVEYCRRRLTDDPHVWLTTLYDEVVELGYAGSYQAYTAAIRRRDLRPRREACAAAKSRDRAVIEHLPGEQTQWDCLVLLGVLSHFGRCRGWIVESEDQPHLIEGLHQIATRLGGLTARWQFDQMATVCHPGSGRIKATLGPWRAIRRRHRYLPCEAGVAQGRGGEGRARGCAAVVAHPARRRHPDPSAGQP
jgi:hypothetical protein